MIKIEHIGIAVPGLEESTSFWRDALGLEVTATEEVDEQGLRVAMLPAGDSRIELLEPARDDSPISKFLAKRGPGIHHIALRVDDIRTMLAQLKERGVKLIDEEPRNGAGGCLVAFIHPSSANGVLVELVQHSSSDNVKERNQF